MSTLDNALQALLDIDTTETLWENARPSSDFGTQTITPAGDMADAIEIIYQNGKSEYIKTTAIKNMGTWVAETSQTSSGMYTVTAAREVTVTDSGITFGNAYGQRSNAARSVSNAYLIPIKICNKRIVE